MKGRIDTNGHLHLDREGTEKKQECPYRQTATGSPQPCGDWCPHFGELRYNTVSPSRDQKLRLAIVHLTCGYQSRSLVFEQLNDERSGIKVGLDN